MLNINLSPKKVYLESEIFSKIKKQYPASSNTHLKWILFEMIKNKEIYRIGTKKYITNYKTYTFEYTNPISNNIEQYLSKKFPLIKSVVWELNQLNEWLNLIIAKKIIIVEIEKIATDIIFSNLKDKFGNKNLLLLNPSFDEIARYMRDNLIIVKTLYSKSPINKNNHKIKLEKLIVDVLADDIISNMLESRGIFDTIHGIIKKYDLNEDQMITYAKRRGVKKELDKIIMENIDAR